MTKRTEQTTVEDTSSWVDMYYFGCNRHPHSYFGRDGRRYEFGDPSAVYTNENGEVIDPPNEDTAPDLRVVAVHPSDVDYLKKRHNITRKNGRNRSKSAKDIILFKTMDELADEELGGFDVRTPQTVVSTPPPPPPPPAPSPPAPPKAKKPKKEESKTE